jgi:magnesium-transporting ATPase (P-type)
LDKAHQILEYDLELFGSTAIEDKLQEEVDLTIQFLKAAGIRVWVLTGDKVDTAINIGISAGLIDGNTEYKTIKKADKTLIESTLDEVARMCTVHKKVGLVIQGDALNLIKAEASLEKKFVDLS